MFSTATDEDVALSMWLFFFSTASLANENCRQAFVWDSETVCIEHVLGEAINDVKRGFVDLLWIKDL